jgi:hypothetical protein
MILCCIGCVQIVSGASNLEGQDANRLESLVGSAGAGQPIPNMPNFGQHPAGHPPFFSKMTIFNDADF